MAIVPLVDERGNSVGYKIGETVFFNWCPAVPVTVIYPEAQKKEDFQVGATISDLSSERLTYAFIARAAYDDGECPFCGRYPHGIADRERHQTDQGKKWLLRCTRCSKLFRPYFT